MTRFYDVAGSEVNVQDPTFYIEEQKAIETKELIENYLADYA